MKIRGTAAHIAEKYMSLARDALASGDMVAAESYFQHAEHYNRIIMAAQTQFGPQHGAQPGEGPNGGLPQPALELGRAKATTTMSPKAGGDIRASSGGGGNPGGGGQDRERHAGNREHHGGGRDRDRHGGQWPRRQR